MSLHSDKITLSTKGFCDVHDITPQLRDILKDSGLKEGLLTVILPGSTGGITTIEHESGVIKDLCEAIEKLVPSGKTYHHDAAWGDGNGFSHVRSAVLGTSLSVPISANRLVLGTWQQVVFIDFDNRPRDRNLHVQLIGQ